MLNLPPEFEPIRDAARRALGDVKPAGPPLPDEDQRFPQWRTSGGRALPEYYLVYFLLVDLLGFDDLGQFEKVAWIVPVRFHGRLYSIEHRKFGIGIFAPSFTGESDEVTALSEMAETDASHMAAAIAKSVSIAEPYFEWRAEQAVLSSRLNVQNISHDLFDRYICFRDRFSSLTLEADRRKEESHVTTSMLSDGNVSRAGIFPSYALYREAKWNGEAAIDAFFSWTEHVFIHLAILQGRASSGEEIAALAEADWKTKCKAALDLSDRETKEHYDKLLDLRAQIRNFMAHGAFGKRGEAFKFHSGAGAVPVLLTSRQQHKYSLTGTAAFDEGAAIAAIEAFIPHIWSGTRGPARHCIFSELPTVLTLVADGTYANAMHSEHEMAEFVEYMTRQRDDASNMDW